MSLDFKIYQQKVLLAATLTPMGAIVIAGSLQSQAIIKHAGRVIWNDNKDGYIRNFYGHDVYKKITERIAKHREKAAVKYSLLKNGQKK